MAESRVSSKGTVLSHTNLLTLKEEQSPTIPISLLSVCLAYSSYCQFNWQHGCAYSRTQLICTHCLISYMLHASHWCLSLHNNCHCTALHGQPDQLLVTLTNQEHSLCQYLLGLCADCPSAPDSLYPLSPTSWVYCCSQSSLYTVISHSTHLLIRGAVCHDMAVFHKRMLFIACHFMLVPIMYLGDDLSHNIIFLLLHVLCLCVHLNVHCKLEMCNLKKRKRKNGLY